MHQRHKQIRLGLADEFDELESVRRSPTGSESNAGSRASVSSGGLALMVQVKLAGVGSTFPAESMARTSKVCAPSERPLKGCGGPRKNVEVSSQPALEFQVGRGSEVVQCR